MLIYKYKSLSLKQAKTYGLDTSDPNIEWITVKGNHIPIKKGLSKEEKGQAIKEFFDKKGEKAHEPIKRQKESAFAGSSAYYDKPSLSAIGSGSGILEHGYGLYYAKDKDTAMRYAEQEKHEIYKNGKQIKLPKDFFDTLYYLIDLKNKSKLKNKGYEIYNDELKFALEQEKKDYKENVRLKKDDLAKIHKEHIDLLNDIDNLEAKTVIKRGQVIRVKLPADKYLIKELHSTKKQTPYVRACLKKLKGMGIDADFNNEESVLDPYTILINYYDDNINKAPDYDEPMKWVSETLSKVGIKGLKYATGYDGFVIFNPDDVKVEKITREE